MKEKKQRRSVKVWLYDYWVKLSYSGLIVGVLFFALSLTPSLIPRHFVFQGFVSGVAIALGVCPRLGIIRAVAISRDS